MWLTLITFLTFRYVKLVLLGDYKEQIKLVLVVHLGVWAIDVYLTWMGNIPQKTLQTEKDSLLSYMYLNQECSFTFF